MSDIECSFSERKKLSKREYKRSRPQKQKDLSRKISHASEVKTSELSSEKVSPLVKDHKAFLQSLQRAKRRHIRNQEANKKLQVSDPCNCGDNADVGCHACQSKYGFDSVTLEMIDSYADSDESSDGYGYDFW